jgi:non-canonical (house-cleaning) NTP pyrophosphatase
MEDIYLASESKLKLDAAREYFKQDVKAMETNSGVSGSPVNEETILGAYNRVVELSKKARGKILLSLESGLFKINNIWYEICYCCVVMGGKLSVGMSPPYRLPDLIGNSMNKSHPSIDYPLPYKNSGYPLVEFPNAKLSRIKCNPELKPTHAQLMNAYREKKGIPQDNKDTISIYTDGRKTRVESFTEAINSAMSQF